MNIDKTQARLITLRQQGLNDNNSITDIINKISYIQIDTISVTERSHNHVIHTRLPSFKQSELEQLMQDKKVFEYWSHAASYLPIKDFKYSLYMKEQYKAGNKHWFPRDKNVDKYVLDRIKAEGPLQSKDFENPRDKNHEWYQWKPAKIALTNLFMDGTIMIKERKGFHKVYDLTENVIPDGIDTSTPTLKEYCKHLIINTINFFGIANIDEICYLRKGVKPTVKNCIKELLENKELVQISIKHNNNKYYSIPSLMNQNIQPLNTNEVHILNPFDNIVIQRKRLKELFDFEYQIECYIPEKKRVYGYYTLPILYGNIFAGRLDAKADRKNKNFIIKNLWFENEFKPDNIFYTEFISKLKAFNRFCGCNKIEIMKTTPVNIKQEIKSLI